MKVGKTINSTSKLSPNLLVISGFSCSFRKIYQAKDQFLHDIVIGVFITLWISSFIGLHKKTPRQYATSADVSANEVQGSTTAIIFSKIAHSRVQLLIFQKECSYSIV